MLYYKNTTQTPNVLFDDLLKEITSISQLKVLLTIVRKTIGQVDPNNSKARIKKAWISQKLFSISCNLSGRAVSEAIEALVKNGYIEVTDAKGKLMDTKGKRRGASKLYYACRLRQEPHKKKASELSSYKPVKKGHTIILNLLNKSCYNSSLGSAERQSDMQRYLEIQRLKHPKNTS